MANTKIHSVKVEGSSTTYDIDLPSNATPSINTLTTSGSVTVGNGLTVASGSITGTLASGITITVNGTSTPAFFNNSANASVSFYAPLGGPTVSENWNYLLGGGDNNTAEPKWQKKSDINVGSANYVDSTLSLNINSSSKSYTPSAGTNKDWGTIYAPTDSANPAHSDEKTETIYWNGSKAVWEKAPVTLVEHNGCYLVSKPLSLGVSAGGSVCNTLYSNEMFFENFTKLEVAQPNHETLTTRNIIQAVHEATVNCARRWIWSGRGFTSNNDDVLILTMDTNGSSAWLNGFLDVAGGGQFADDLQVDTNIYCSNTIQGKTFNATSDLRLKENIKEYKPKKSILELPLKEFDFKENKEHHIGCLAQDLQEIAPELVHEGKDGYLSIEESKLVYLLIDEVKQLKEEIELLKKGK